MTNIIIKQDTRILTPREFSKLIQAIPKLKHQTLIKALLFTGMRYKELERFYSNPNWLMENGFINLPKGSILKKKCRQKERWIRLNPLGKEVINNFLNTKMNIPTRQTLNKDLQRWCIKAEIDKEGICVKAFRKTLVSWLVFTYPQRLLEIMLSMGHTEATSIKHYLGLPFTDMDKETMKTYIGGW